MAQLVQAPSRKPRSGGIKEIAGEYISVDHLGIAPLAWEDATCGFPARTQAGCWDTTGPTDDKEFDGFGEYTSIADPFALYAGVECWVGGDTDGQTYPVLASTKLEQGEDRALEAGLVTWALAAADAETSATLIDAIAAADQYADANYVGQPVLVMPRAAADLGLAAGVLTFLDGKLVTANKTPVLATSSYAAAADLTVSAIGWPAVYASTAISRETISPRDNLGRGLAERIYAVGVDCGFRFTVTVETTP